MNQLIEKTFNGTDRVRIVTIDGQPWFVAADVCRALGLNMAAGASPHVKKLAADEKRLVLSADVPNSGLGRAPSISAISESGLYKLILRSDRPEAKQFQDWVTRDVLPAIRKDGAYVMGEEKVATGELSLEEMTLRVVEAMRNKIARLEEEKEKLEPLAQIGGQAVAHDHSLPRFIRTLPGVNTMRVKGDLYAHNYLYRKCGTYRVYSRFHHLFNERVDARTGQVELFPKPAGRAQLIRMYEGGPTHHGGGTLSSARGGVEVGGTLLCTLRNALTRDSFREPC
jgi:prophage antirepressor-like protein